MLGCYGYCSYIMNALGSFIKHVKRQAVLGSVKMVIHDQARMVIRDVAAIREPEVVLNALLA